MSLRVPLLTSTPINCKPFILDTPGFNEATRKRSSEIAQASLQNSCAYLFVINYRQMRDSGDAEILKYLHTIDKCKSALAEYLPHARMSKGVKQLVLSVCLLASLSVSLSVRPMKNF